MVRTESVKMLQEHKGVSWWILMGEVGEGFVKEVAFEPDQPFSFPPPATPG